jgi:ABC-type phosphate transport system permease subunit
LIIGGFLSYYVKRAIDKRVKNDPSELRAEKEHKASQVGMLISCGMVAGASVMAVILAIPFGIKGSADALRLIPDSYDALAEWLGATVTVILILWFRKRVMKAAN